MTRHPENFQPNDIQITHDLLFSNWIFVWWISIAAICVFVPRSLASVPLFVCTHLDPSLALIVALIENLFALAAMTYYMSPTLLPFALLVTFQKVIPIIAMQYWKKRHGIRSWFDAKSVPITLFMFCAYLVHVWKRETTLLHVYAAVTRSLAEGSGDRTPFMRFFRELTADKRAGRYVQNRM